MQKTILMNSQLVRPHHWQTITLGEVQQCLSLVDLSQIKGSKRYFTPEASKHNYLPLQEVRRELYGFLP